MMRFLFILAAAVLCAGQMCSPPLDASHLVVTDTLRQACPQFDDENITMLLEAAEMDRVNGFDEATSRDNAAIACDGAEDVQGCQNCLRAVMDQVYASN